MVVESQLHSKVIQISQTLTRHHQELREHKTNTLAIIDSIMQRVDNLSSRRCALSEEVPNSILPAAGVAV